jgi:hypothetical protein
MILIVNHQKKPVFLVSFQNETKKLHGLSISIIKLIIFPKLAARIKRLRGHLKLNHI